jgi:hypothetical protein
MTFKPKPFLLSTLLSLVALCFPASIEAQFIGYTSPQTVQQSLAVAVPCTGSAQNFAVQNLGQTQHYAFITYSAQPMNALVVMQGIDLQGNAAVISDTMQGQPSTTGGSAVLVGLGYFPKIQIQVICATGGSPTFTLTYMGTSSTSFVPQGAQIATEVDKVLLTNAPANANGGSQLATPPFGNSAGQVVFQYSVTGPAGSSLLVQCGGSSPSTNIGTGHIQLYTFPLATGAGQQLFAVPASPCPFYNVQYTSGGASAATYNLEYFFAPPGLAAPGFQGANITGTTATAVKGTSGFLHNLTINTGAAGTITLFDLPLASCTGTPATNQKGIVTATATTLETLLYDINFVNGICVQASAAMNLTVSFY